MHLNVQDILSELEARITMLRLALEGMTIHRVGRLAFNRELVEAISKAMGVNMGVNMAVNMAVKQVILQAMQVIMEVTYQATQASHV